MIAAGAVLVALALLVGLAWRGGTSAPAGIPAVPGVGLGAGAASTPADAAPTGAAPTAEPVHGAEERQVCGGRWVKVDADGGIEGDLPGEADVAKLRETTIAKLRADPDDYSRAVADWLRGGDDAALVDRARGTRNAAVYALAFSSCRRPAAAPDPACSLLSAAQWARLDPGNAMPWLFALADAALRKDAAGVDEALFQVGASNRSATNAFAPLLPVLDALPPGDASLLAAFGLALQAVGTSVASLPPLQTVRQACRGAAIADANRRQVCTRAADVLAERSDDLLSRLVGGRMVSELTGSPDRQALQRAEMQAWTAAQFPGDGTVADALGCQSVRRTLDRLREQAVLGEVGAIRRWVDASGLTPTELLGRARRFDARRAAAAASATGAATAEATTASAPETPGPVAR